MEINEFVIQLYHLISDQSIETYINLFENPKNEEITDSFWKNAIAFYQKVSDEDKQCFFRILKQVTIDTTAEILAILDNSAYLKNKDDDLELFFKRAPNEKINGDLVDVFLAFAEEQDKKKRDAH